MLRTTGHSFPIMPVFRINGSDCKVCKAWITGQQQIDTGQADHGSGVIAVTCRQGRVRIKRLQRHVYRFSLSVYRCFIAADNQGRDARTRGNQLIAARKDYGMATVNAATPLWFAEVAATVKQCLATVFIRSTM